MILGAGRYGIAFTLITYTTPWACASLIITWMDNLTCYPASHILLKERMHWY